MTQSIHQTLDDDRRLPWPEAMGKATIRARFMLAYADADADALPDAHAPRGTVTLTYAGSGYRWTDADGSRLVAALPVVCPILPDGTLGSPDHNLAMNGRVIIMPTEVAGLEPAGSTVTATIRIANAQAKFEPVTFTVKPDDDINLAELVSVQATPGVVTVVDDTIAVRAEAAANRAEDAASDVGGALTQITAATETAQNLSDTIMAAVDEVTTLEEHASRSASIAETAATEAVATLAGKVSGQGMTLRHDTSVGTRLFLDHPGGSTMLYGDTGWRSIPATSKQIPGLTHMFIRRTTHHLHAAIYANMGFTPGSLEVIATLPPGFRTGRDAALNKAPFAIMNAYTPGDARPSHTAIVRDGEVQLRMEGPGRLHATLTTWAEPDWPTSQHGTPL